MENFNDNDDANNTNDNNSIMPTIKILFTINSLKKKYSVKTLFTIPFVKKNT